MRKLESVVTPFNDVDVWEDWKGQIDFNVVGATHATWHPENLMTGHAWDAITGGCLLHPGKAGNLLMLGLGGGTALRQLRHFLPEISMTAVEIDGEMIRLARQYMDLDSLNVEVIHEDAFLFLENSPTKFDLIIDDLYRCGDYDVERPAMVNQTLLTRHAEHLKGSGTLIMNFVVGRGHHKMHRSAREAFLQGFQSVRTVRPPRSHNEVIVGTNSMLPLQGPGALQNYALKLTDPLDQKYWRELRNLKLR